MRIAVKLAVSIVVLLVVLLGVAAAVELGFGERRPALTNLTTLVIAAPVLFAIWRR